MHVCLFDIDGTLLHTGGAGQRAMEAAIFAEFGHDRPVSGISTAGRTDRAITEDLFAYYGIDRDPDRFERFFEAYLRLLPRHLAGCAGHVYPGIVEVLDRLSVRDDVLLGLLTGNLREGAQLKLAHYGIHHYFVVGGYGDAHPQRDDVARAALAAVRAHLCRDVPSKRLWVIGDTPADVQCGRAIGANVIAVCTGSFSLDELRAAAPDHLFEDFSDPDRVLALFDAGSPSGSSQQRLA